MLPWMHYMRPLGPAQQDILRHSARKVRAAVGTRGGSVHEKQGQLVSRRGVPITCGYIGPLARWKLHVASSSHHRFSARTALGGCNLSAFGVMYAFFILLVRSRYRQLGPHNMDPRMSYVAAVSPEELNEELEGAQMLLGDVAAQGERLVALFNWRDPRAAEIFVVFCVVASLVFYMVPFKAFVLGSGFYYLRHPRFHDGMPSVPSNFFGRLPSLSDQIM
ncbi:hypothetical protein ACFX2H_013588 [Malus domestica]